MENRNYCQSCSMPLDKPELLGTEKDGSPSNEYCKYCYQNGEFTSPGLTLDEMKDRMTRMMDKENLPEDILEAAINRLPHLKRWKTETAPSASQGS
jgi:hypothetical protein